MSARRSVFLQTDSSHSAQQQCLLRLLLPLRFPNGPCGDNGLCGQYLKRRLSSLGRTLHFLLFPHPNRYCISKNLYNGNCSRRWQVNEIILANYQSSFSYISHIHYFIGFPLYFTFLIPLLEYIAPLFDIYLTCNVGKHSITSL